MEPFVSPNEPALAPDNQANQPPQYFEEKVKLFKIVRFFGLSFLFVEVFILILSILNKKDGTLQSLLVVAFWVFFLVNVILLIVSLTTARRLKNPNIVVHSLTYCLSVIPWLFVLLLINFNQSFTSF